MPLITLGPRHRRITSGISALSAENVLRYHDPRRAPTRRRSSVASRAARESARSVRGAITSEMYEDLNSAWLEVRGYDYARIESSGVSRSSSNG